MEPETISSTLGDVKAKGDTLAVILVWVQVKSGCKTVNEVEDEELVHTQPDILLQVEADRVSDTLSDVEDKTLIDMLTDLLEEVEAVTLVDTLANVKSEA